jgi:quercetin dioxygenase-like cupin family protein
METKLFGYSQVMNLKDRVDYSEEGIVSKRVIQKEKGNITLFAFDRGQKLSEHTAPYDALVQVLEGKADIMIDGNPFEVEEGQAIIMPAHIPHAVSAFVRFKMLLIMIKN